MPIKIKCPSCQKLLSVKESMAGKRGACPVCKYMLTIPALTGPGSAPPERPPAPLMSRAFAPPPAKAPEPAPSAEELERQAAALLNDVNKDGPVEPPKTVEFHC